ncbi:hypothetical protein [Saccharicrinis fermentans]|uniref:Uncharacterized protein n=1 Tax=Saccharicrinis fermentans DSM 9555 = JCM 21142 TaxID=869213 RepID=W7YI26_9BACT|nr:hypothetical protein [Saccharicrinis fermentans]GAF04121.1 hypothetical protein JCM21142_72816 [Saccharicrinis fermentans DSM 9555 = JCM 21142]
MKILTVTITVFMIVSICGANASAETYEEIMRNNIKQMYKVQTARELQAISASFYRVANKEQDKWLPLYYASYSLVRIAFFVKADEEIARHLDVAQSYMDRLLEFKPKESEIYVLQALLYSMRITGPASGMKYSILSNSSLDRAEELDNENPRLYYCRANNIYHTPTMFGGGKKKAKPLFEKANALFNQQSPKGDLWPSWGQWHTQEMLKQYVVE